MAETRTHFNSMNDIIFMEREEGGFCLGAMDMGQPDVKQVAVVAESTDNTLVAAVTDNKIRVLQCILQVTGSCLLRFESGTGGTALTGQMPVVAGAITAVLSGSNGYFILPYSPIGWFQTASNQLLNLELSTSSAYGTLSYREIPA